MFFFFATLKNSQFNITMKGPEGRTSKSSLLLPNKSGYGTSTTFEAKPYAGSLSQRNSQVDEDDKTDRKQFSTGPSHSFFSGSPSTTASMASERKLPMRSSSSSQSFSVVFLVYCVIYALINVVISVPGLFGYAAVIFNHKVFAPHMNALSKLVISSSFMHQLAFTLFSSLPFAIGTVQDAGLIFLSAMSNKIATIILEGDNGTEEEVISTVLVLLSVGTAALGLVLIAIGHFRLAE
jgi:SulP family sulfate permease